MILTRAKKRTLILLGVLAMVVISIVTFRHTILISFGEYLITQSPLEKADAILVLGGSVPDRILEAVDIYKQGYAPLIILTKGPQPQGYDELLKLGIKVPEGHQLNQIIAEKLGVPESAIVTIGKRADSTYSELQTVYKDFLKKKGLKSIILVTSKSHTTRATIIFNHVTNGEIKVITRPSKYDSFNPINWWKVRRDLGQTLFEYQKLAHHYLFDYGSNTQ
ncbi:MAG: YdcF family protein [Deltaproteobacteria bacterium]|nr:YdcF family protein [Deltaproteobacteria bacterium]